MVGNARYIFFDSEIAPKIHSIFEQAQKYVVVVSPFLQLWEDAEEAVQQARARDVDIRFIFLDESKRRSEKDKQALRELSQWLKDLGVELFALDQLHAKIYMNEKTVLLSSMNMTESSLRNPEVAHVVNDRESESEIRLYVTGLMRKVQTTTWFCARCLQPIAPNLKHPLCKKCWFDWEKENARFKGTPPL